MTIRAVRPTPTAHADGRRRATGFDDPGPDADVSPSPLTLGVTR